MFILKLELLISWQDLKILAIVKLLASCCLQSCAKKSLKFQLKKFQGPCKKKIRHYFFVVLRKGMFFSSLIHKNMTKYSCRFDIYGVYISDNFVSKLSSCEFFHTMNEWIHFYYSATCFCLFFGKNWKNKKDIIWKMFWNYTKSLVNTNSFHTNFTNTHFQKVRIPHLTRTMKQKFLH